MKKWIALVVAVLLALGVYVAVGPYLTVRAIRSAVQQQDAAALSRQVDFPALRASLKAQLSNELVRGAGSERQANPFAAIGLQIASGVIGAGVDAMVNPFGLAAIMEGRTIWRKFDDEIGSPPPDTAAPERQPLHDARYRYESPSRFTATVQDEDGRPLVFVMTRDGLRWKLTDIRLPRDTD